MYILIWKRKIGQQRNEAVLKIVYGNMSVFSHCKSIGVNVPPTTSKVY